VPQIGVNFEELARKRQSDALEKALYEKRLEEQEKHQQQIAATERLRQEDIARKQQELELVEKSNPCLKGLSREQRMRRLAESGEVHQTLQGWENEHFLLWFYDSGDLLRCAAK
jgi:hypothetical protein